MVTNWYPFHKAEEVAKVQQKVPQKFPSFIKKWQLFGTADGKRGIKGVGIVYTDPEKVDEAGIYIAKVMSLFSEVEGYTWKVEPMMSMRDIQKMVSLQI
jgi:hypothetical protein